MPSCFNTHNKFTGSVTKAKRCLGLDAPQMVCHIIMNNLRMVNNMMPNDMIFVG